MTEGTIDPVELAASITKKYTCNAEVRQDIEQEGVLAALEAIDSGVDDPDKLKGIVRKHMNAYISQLQYPVHVPRSTAYKAREKGQERLLKELRGSIDPMDHEDSLLTDGTDHPKDFEDQEYLELVYSAAEECLKGKPLNIFRELYVKGHSVDSLAEQLECTEGHVRYWRDGAIQDINVYLKYGKTNLLWVKGERQ